MNELNFCGIDVAKRNFVIGISRRKQTKTFTNNPKGILQAVEYLKNCANLSLIVLESTGGLEIPLAKALHRADFRVVIANPRQTHQFAMAKSLAKTDAKDAKMLASYAKMLVLDDEVEKHLYLPPTPEMEQLEALVLRRTQLVEMRVAEKNRLHQVHDSQRESVQQLIAHFDGLIDELNAANVARQHEPKFKAFYERLIARGKPFKVAVNACMRKLLTVINAIVRDGSQWNAHAV